jgi:small GTP-binding protein
MDFEGLIENFEGIWNEAISLAEPKKGAVNLKVGLLGNTDVGKTSLSRRFGMREVPDDKARNLRTVGIDTVNCFLKIDLHKLLEPEINANGGSLNGVNLDDNVIRLSIWDTAGQEQASSVNHTYVRGVDGMLLVSDLTRMHTFETISEWSRQVLSL